MKTYNVDNLYKKYCPSIDNLLKSIRKKELLLWSDFNDICKNNEIFIVLSKEEYLILLKIKANEFCEDKLRNEIDLFLLKYRKEIWEIEHPGLEFRYENIKDIA